MRISLIIITRDKVERLKLVLLACAAHAGVKADEIIVVDDGEHSQASKAVCEQSSDLPLRFIAGPRRGRAAARNAGAVQANYSILVFIDDDILTKPDFIAKHAAAQDSEQCFVRGRIRELIGAVTCSNFSVGGVGFLPVNDLELGRLGFNPKGYRLSTSQLERAVEARFCENRLQIPGWIASAGANFSVPRALWDRVGGQDERFGREWGCEDLELSYRLQKSGVDFKFAVDAIGFHLSHVQPDRWLHHAHTFDLFCRIHSDSEIAALSFLLGSKSSLDLYLGALESQMRSP